MFLSSGITGHDLPSKTVCLTFDDGPGPHTLEIAQFLHGRNIEATFFVIGEFASTQTDILHRLTGMGHLIGNHTYDHPHLADCRGEFAADQIVRSDQILAGLAQPFRCFRPPYGSWSPTLAGELNWTAASHYLGPILWDIDAKDWKFWAAGRPANECASAYIESIRDAGRGVILMHDSSFEPEIRLRNNTFEAVRPIVDWLQENGYSFVRLDAIPQVRESARVTSIVSLQAAGGYDHEPVGMVELGNNQIALRSLSGGYLSINEGEGGRVLVNSSNVGEAETFTRIRLGDWEAFRVVTPRPRRT